MGVAILNHENRVSFKWSTDKWVKEHVFRLLEVKGGVRSMVGGRDFKYEHKYIIFISILK